MNIFSSNNSFDASNNLKEVSYYNYAWSWRIEKKLNVLHLFKYIQGGAYVFGQFLKVGVASK